MKKLIAIGITIFISSCTTSSGPETSADSSIIADSFVVADSIFEPPVISYNIDDSTWTLSSSRALTAKEVKKLFYPVKENSGEKLTWYINRYFELDSMLRKLKQNDSDPGSVVSVKIRFLDTIYANMDYTLCSWLIDYKTEEQCPYASGTVAAISSFDSNGNLISSACVGENSSGSDSPLTWERKRSSVIYSNGEISIQQMEESGEDEDIEIITTAQNGIIFSSGIIKLEEENEVSKKRVKKKTAN